MPHRPHVVPAPSPALLRFARRQAHNSAVIPDVERRSEARQILVEPVIVQRVDRLRKPLGMPLAAVTRDLSPQGVGLIFEQPMKHNLVALQFALNGEQVCLLVDVLWREPVGPFEYAGCQILHELDEFPMSESQPNY